MSHFNAFLVILGFGLLFSPNIFAQTSISSPSRFQNHYDGVLLAQLEGGDESFDPFSDYSEFDEASEEEADINFFRNGRFFTVGFMGGYRSFSGNMSQIYGSGPTYGLVLNYFFDLKMALNIGFITGDHPVNIKTNLRPIGYDGNVSLTMINFNLKYYLTTQNVTKGLADLNPYILGGFAQHYRTYSISGIEELARDATMGVDLGLGIELPLMKRKGFFGIQGAYHYVNFVDENKDFLQGTELLNKRINGDYWDALIIVGLSY